MNAFKVDEKQACVWFDRVTKRMKRAEAAGVPLPAWLTSLAAGVLVGNSEGALSNRARLFLIVSFSCVVADLPVELRQGIEGAFAGIQVPDALPVELLEIE